MLKGTAKSETAETPNKSSDKSVKTENKSRSTEDRSIHKADGTAEHSLRSTAPEKIEAAKQVAHTGSIKRMVETSVPAMHQITAHVSSGLNMTHDIGRLGGMGMMHTGGLGGMHMGGMHLGGIERSRRHAHERLRQDVSCAEGRHAELNALQLET